MQWAECIVEHLPGGAGGGEDAGLDEPQRNSAAGWVAEDQLPGVAGLPGSVDDGVLGAVEVAAQPVRGAAVVSQRDVRPGAVGQGGANTAFGAVRRAGTVSIIGVYGGQADPFPMKDLFDKSVTLRMGQAHVKRWVDEIMPALTRDDDPLGTGDLITHRLPLEQAPYGYEIFKNKQDGCIKVVLEP